MLGAKGFASTALLFLLGAEVRNGTQSDAERHFVLII